MQQQSGPLFILSTILTGLLSAAGFLYWVGMAETDSEGPRTRDSSEWGGRHFVSELAKRHGLDATQEQDLEEFVREERRHLSEFMRDVRSAPSEEAGTQQVSAAWQAHSQWRSKRLRSLFPAELAKTLSRELQRGDEQRPDGRGRGFDGPRPGR